MKMRLILGICTMLLLINFSCNKTSSHSDEKMRHSWEMSYNEIHELMKGYTEEWPDIQSDQRQGIPAPPIQKPYPADAIRIDLVKHTDFTIGNVPFFQVVNQRRSRRSYTGDSLTVEELSYLLWCTQGIQKMGTRQDGSVAYTLRTVPSGGARHPFETYLLINRVKGITPGIYRYLAVEHQLLTLHYDDELPEKVTEATYDQKFVGEAAVVFIWATVPYRMEWRYNYMGHKDVTIEAGHLCQNLYLAAESIGAGACAIAAYDQKLIDNLITVDGKDEFTIYLAPVGKIKSE
jgi:SagB-type dehydrogenase family enzyme